MKKIIAAILIIVFFTPILASADALLEAQMIALDLSGQLLPPEELTQQILEDLAAIRAAYPEIADIHYAPPYAPDQIIIGLTDEAFAQYQQGQYHALDELNTFYGVVSIGSWSFIKAIILTFDRVYNAKILSDIYEQAHPEGLRYAEPNYRIGDGSTIYADPPYYTFQRAWGDCPSGCIYHKNWRFEVENGNVTFFNTWYVNAADGNDANFGLRQDAPLATIQKAIDSASDGEVIAVAPGTYSGPGNRNIEFKGKAVTVRSYDPNDPNVVAATIIDCTPANSGDMTFGFQFARDEDANSIIDGLTITNATGSGVRCVRTSPVINNCIIMNCQGYKGAGVYCCEGRTHLGLNGWISTYPTITNCTIKENTSDRGGGIFCDRSNPPILNCAIIDNYSDGEGGGIYCDWKSNPTITNCTITGNHAWQGGGISCKDSSLTVTNCTITDNSATWEGGGICCYFQGRPTITNCTITGNYAVEGGGICLRSINGDVTISNCVISGNSAHSQWDAWGGGIYGDDCQGRLIISNCKISANKATSAGGSAGGGIWFGRSWRDRGVIITNCIVSENIAEAANYSASGGGICFFDVYSDELIISNCTISGNSADCNETSQGGGIFSAGDVTIENSILWDNKADNGSQLYEEIREDAPGSLLNYCNIQGGWSGTGNINANPSFRNSIDGNYNLFSNSPCINTGDPNYISEPNETDLEGNPRVIDDRIDMGAYEFSDTTPPEFNLSVSPNILWPANHKMIKITPVYDVNDLCDPEPEVSLVDITTNERGNADDIRIDSDGSIHLCATRTGNSKGRIYTLTYQACDASGNCTTRSCTVIVPHDNRK